MIYIIPPSINPINNNFEKLLHNQMDFQLVPNFSICSQSYGNHQRAKGGDGDDGVDNDGDGDDSH